MSVPPTKQRALGKSRYGGEFFGAGTPALPSYDEALDESGAGAISPQGLTAEAGAEQTAAYLEVEASIGS